MKRDEQAVRAIAEGRGAPLNGSAAKKCGSTRSRVIATLNHIAG